MSHERRPVRPVEQYSYVETCRVCGKKAYPSRRVAKVKARQFHPGQTHRFYQCRDSDLWHFTSASALRTEAWKDWRAS